MADSSGNDEEGVLLGMLRVDDAGPAQGCDARNSAPMSSGTNEQMVNTAAVMREAVGVRETIEWQLAVAEGWNVLTTRLLDGCWTAAGRLLDSVRRLPPALVDYQWRYGTGSGQPTLAVGVARDGWGGEGRGGTEWSCH